MHGSKEIEKRRNIDLQPALHEPAERGAGEDQVGAGGESLHLDYSKSDGRFLLGAAGS